MKKHECNYCKKNQNHPCREYGGVHDDSGNQTTYSTLYAAEFLLYAFHFQNNNGGIETEARSAHPLMMMVVEG